MSPRIASLRAAPSNAGNQFPVALQHPDDASLVALVAAAHAAHGTANQRLVNLDNRAGTAERIVAVERAPYSRGFGGTCAKPFCR